MKQKKDFNYKIAQLFLKNTRLIVLSLMLLLLLGIIATFSLKSTGFPNPSVNIAQVLTVYPGATSETVQRDVTLPIEQAVKGIDGVKNYRSVSQDSASIVVVTIDEKANEDAVKSKLDSAVRSAKLPSGVQPSKINSFQVGGPDYGIVISGQNLAEVYKTAQQFETEVNLLNETASIEQINALKKNVLVKLDLAKMKKYGITVSDVSTQLASVGETLPVVSDVTIDKTNQTVITTVSGKTLKDIENINFQVIKQQAPKIQYLKLSFPAIPGMPAMKPLVLPMPVMQGPKVYKYKLKQFGTVTFDYKYEDSVNNKVALNGGQEMYAVTYLIKTVENIDSKVYSGQLREIMGKFSNSELLVDGELLSNYDKNKVYILEAYSVNTENQAQLDEVISGLIGGELPIKNEKLAKIGWLLGGIQLVVLAMMLLVSWRAALVSALAIPLSLLFSTIYLYLTGEQMNTLVLFSLVLVIGLVVDPALVLLESLQRKIDIGLKGTKAALAAVKDIGMGLFLAALTDVIVFVPFGVISGIMGEIFKYIPITVIPALVGSYVVPVVFLSWLGAKFLKKSKNSTEDEIDNLPKVAKWLISANRVILNSARWVRLLIILIVLVILPIVTAGYYFSTGKVKQVSFATTENANNFVVTGSFKANTTEKQKQDATSKVLKIVTNTPHVQSIYQIQSGFTYYVNLVPYEERPANPTAYEIAKNLNDELETLRDTEFYDLSVAVVSTSGSTPLYDLAISIKSNDISLFKVSAIDVGNTLEKSCLKDGVVSFPDKCDGERIVEKVDDGFTDKSGKVVEIQLDRNKLATKQLVISNAPVGFWSNQQIRQNFVINGGEKAGTISIDNEQLDIMLAPKANTPAKTSDINNLKVTAFDGKDHKVKDIASIKATESKNVIQRNKGQTFTLVQARLRDGYRNQSMAGLVNKAVIDHYNNYRGERTKALNLKPGSIEVFSEGDSAMFAKSFSELIQALILAIFITYFVFVLFFRSFTLPLVIVFTVPLTFIGAFPALAHIGTGELGFLEVIGVIILVGIVENVAIFLIDAAKQRNVLYSENDVEAIAKASGVRFRPILLTKVVTSASLLPLVLFSDFYRNMSLVLIFGLLASGFTSLITTPILYVFFRWLSAKFRGLDGLNKALFLILFPIYLTGWWIAENNKRFSAFVERITT